MLFTLTNVPYSILVPVVDTPTVVLGFSTSKYVGPNLCIS